MTNIVTNSRENLLLNILLWCLGIYAVVTLSIIVNCVASLSSCLLSEFHQQILLGLSTIAALIFFGYLLWVLDHATRVLVLGDNASDIEKLIANNDAILLGEQLRTQIIPKALIEQESPRARFHIKAFKGSYFYPPRILISINICSLLEGNEGELVLKSIQLNRILELLRHKKRLQKIDVIFNHMDKLEGYHEFKNAADIAMTFSSYLPLGPQLASAQNTTKALLDNTTFHFMQFLKFAHGIPDLSNTIDKLLADLLLVDKEANSRVFLTS
jgi:hypothetical protein